MPTLPPDDVRAIVEAARDDLEGLRGARLFVTGGTGFVGRWLLETVLAADGVLDLGVHLVVLSRSPDAFALRAPAVANAPQVSMWEGDVRSFPPPSGWFTHVIHAAAEASTDLAVRDPDEMYDVVARGAARVAEFARACGAGRMLFLSSGAVYGPLPPGRDTVDEEFEGYGTEDLGAYALAKREAERLLGEPDHPDACQAVIARLFAFVGPGISLDHHAIGNFIRDAVAGRPIIVRGDGTPVRSYMYATDMVTWLLAALIRGVPGRAYNVGSEKPYTVSEVARLVAAAVEPAAAIELSGDSRLTGAGGSRYVPSTRRIREELGVRESVDLVTGIRRTVDRQAVRRP